MNCSRRLVCEVLKGVNGGGCHVELYRYDGLAGSRVIVKAATDDRVTATQGAPRCLSALDNG